MTPDIHADLQKMVSILRAMIGSEQDDRKNAALCDILDRIVYAEALYSQKTPSTMPYKATKWVCKG